MEDQPLSYDQIVDKMIRWKGQKPHQISLFLGDSEYIFPHEVKEKCEPPIVTKITQIFPAK